ncbi:WD40 repeat domain-containing protein [Sulfurovum sp.]|uniref:WD40 repeat domain-containing protein n=1 Tax=Sulfurovum sp. TaxID=1969726 RepID=UPI0025F338F4|nr:WD40 repeat domain-containing protein [Sulfurovum sp.]
MHRIFIAFFVLFLTIEAENITPIATVKASGIVSDFVEDSGYLYVATDAGSVDIIDLSTQKIVKQIRIEPFRTAMGDIVPARVHSVDRYQGRTLLVTSGASAYRNVWINDGKKLKKIIDEKQHMMPKRAYFTNEGKILLDTFGSDVILYDYEENYKLYESHISESTMGGMLLSQDKKKMIISDESGAVRVIDVKSSKVEQTLDSEHVDNIYSVAYRNGVIITAGQDRRVGIYRADKKAYHIKSDFLVYCVGLSPGSDVGVYSSGIDHDLQLFNTKDGKKTDRLVGHISRPNKIMFINEKALISSGDGYTVYFWMIGK